MEVTEKNGGVTENGDQPLAWPVVPDLDLGLQTWEQAHQHGASVQKGAEGMVASSAPFATADSVPPHGMETIVSLSQRAPLPANGTSMNGMRQKRQAGTLASTDTGQARKQRKISSVETATQTSVDLSEQQRLCAGTAAGKDVNGTAGRPTLQYSVLDDSSRIPYNVLPDSTDGTPQSHPSQEMPNQSMANLRRRYDQVEDNGMLISAFGALIPEGYSRDQERKFPWKCPVRLCGHVRDTRKPCFGTLAELGAHFAAAHRRELLRDDGDGFFTRVGFQAHDAVASVPAVVSQPWASTQVLPPQVPAFTVFSATRSSSPSSSSSPGPSNEPHTNVEIMWQYLLPIFCRNSSKQGEDLEQQGLDLTDSILADQRAAALANLGKKRDIVQREGTKLALETLDQAKAFLIQVTGTLAYHPCSECNRGNGPFVGCIQEPYLGESGPAWGGSCANCMYNGANCSIRGAQEQVEPSNLSERSSTSRHAHIHTLLEPPPPPSLPPPDGSNGSIGTVQSEDLLSSGYASPSVDSVPVGGTSQQKLPTSTHSLPTPIGDSSVPTTPPDSDVGSPALSCVPFGNGSLRIVALPAVMTEPPIQYYRNATDDTVSPPVGRAHAHQGSETVYTNQGGPFPTPSSNIRHTKNHLQAARSLSRKAALQALGTPNTRSVQSELSTAAAPNFTMPTPAPGADYTTLPGGKASHQVLQNSAAQSTQSETFKTLTQAPGTTQTFSWAVSNQTPTVQSDFSSAPMRPAQDNASRINDISSYAAEVSKKEIWEQAPGRLRSVASETPDAIAFSRAYLTGTEPVRVCKEAYFLVRSVGPGTTVTFEKSETTMRLCAVGLGKLHIQLEGEPIFVVGILGMFKIGPGVVCTVANEMGMDAMLQITSIILDP